MTTIESLRHEAARIRARIGRPSDTKRWVFQLAEDMEIPGCIEAQFGASDTAFIEWMRRDIFYGMFGQDALGSCTVITLHGNYIVSMDTGRWTKVHFR